MEQADIGILEEHSSSIEEQLRAEFITYNDLPEQVADQTYISVQQHIFKEEELQQFDSFQKQDTYLLNQHSLLAILHEPMELELEKDNLQESFKDLLEKIIFYPEEYSYWNWDEEMNVIICFQHKEELPVYYNSNGIVLMFLNHDQEVTHYVQTKLGDSEPLAEKRSLMEPIRAIETLYDANELKTGDHISKVNIGFHTRVPFDTGVQVFAPIWKVTVNEEVDYFVNAIEGFIFSSNEQDFLEEVISSFIKKIEAVQEETAPLDMIVNDLETRLQLIQTSG